MLKGLIISTLICGSNIEIIIPNPVSDDFRNKLPDNVSFINTNEHDAPNSRFTLLNSKRSGSEMLAIARSIHPNHEVTIFDTNSGPQIIAMAKDLIHKSKELSKNAQTLE